MSTIPALAYKTAVKHHDQALPLHEQRKRKKQLRVVQSNKRLSSSAVQTVSLPFPVFMLAVSAITIGMIVNVAQHALVSQSSYEIEVVKKEIQLEQQKKEKLLATMARLDSPKRIETIATGKLSMVKAPKVSYVRIDGQSIAGVSPEQNNAATR